jgi:DNA mismatch repair protein MutS
MALIADYFAKTKQYKDEYGERTILLMQVGAFFEVYGKQDPKTKVIHGSEIMEFSQVCDLNVVEKKAHVGSDEVLMAGFKDIYIEKYVKRLQDAGFTIPVHVQDENCKDTERSLYQIYSPGTYFNEDVAKITNVITCVWFNVVEQNSLFSKIMNKKSRKPRVNKWQDQDCANDVNPFLKFAFNETGNNSASKIYPDSESSNCDYSSVSSLPNPLRNSNDSNRLSNNSTSNNSTSNNSTSNNSTSNSTNKYINVSKVNKMIYIGVANIDIYTGTSSIFEYNEQYINNNPTTFDELERIFSINSPSEVILIGNITLSEMDNIIGYSNIQCDLIHKIPLESGELTGQMAQKLRAQNCEKQIYQKAILEKFYEITDFNSFVFNFNESTFATQAFCYLLDFIYQHNPNLLKKISEPVFESHSNKLILANHTLKQLNIIDDNNYTGKNSSVVKMLNAAITSMGKRKFTHSLLTPIINEDHLNAEYSITEYLLSVECNNQAAISYETIREILTDIKDISKCMRQIILKRISPKTMYQLYNNIKSIIVLYNNVMFDETITRYLSKHNIVCARILSHCEELLAFLKKRFDLDACKCLDGYHNFDCNFIKANISQELDEKTKTLADTSDRLAATRNFFNEVMQTYEKNAKSTEFIKIHETEKNNFSLASTKRRCKLLQTALKSRASCVTTIKYVSSFDYTPCQFELSTDVDIVDGTASNDCIVSAQIKDMCKNITIIKLSLKDTVNKVYNEIVDSMDTHIPQLEELSNFVATIDVIYAKAHIARKHNFCKPAIDSAAPKSFVNIKGLRHCLIEQLNHNELYVSNDILLGKKCDGVLLYGTNAVGKTSFIRAIGIAVILAQAGLYVPASEFTYKPYHCLFSRIIGNDNIFKGLSTFAVEMTELRNILRLMNENSLILGDELCSGTESISAVSIFVAGIQRMHMAKSSFIFATHLHEIVNFDEIVEMSTVHMKHMEVIYDKAKDILVYDRKLKDGPGQNMYGLEVCKSLNLPDDFLQSAYNIRMKYHPECSGVLASKSTHFNARKIKSAICEFCKKEVGAEIHHLQHQQDANNDHLIIRDGYSFNKNHVANLITVCEKCHEMFHDTGKQHKKVMTSAGVIIQEI